MGQYRDCPSLVLNKQHLRMELFQHFLDPQNSCANHSSVFLVNAFISRSGASVLQLRFIEMKSYVLPVSGCLTGTVALRGLSVMLTGIQSDPSIVRRQEEIPPRSVTEYSMRHCPPLFRNRLTPLGIYSYAKANDETEG